MTKYCVNCKHFSPKVGDEHHVYARCAVSTRNNPISLVTGKQKHEDLPYAEVMRMSAAGNMCGVEALFFEEANNV
jgi:hypothetical protein